MQLQGAGLAHTDEDVLESGHSSWQKSSIDNEWVPQDGFKKK